MKRLASMFAVAAVAVAITPSAQAAPATNTAVCRPGPIELVMMLIATARGVAIQCDDGS